MAGKTKAAKPSADKVGKTAKTVTAKEAAATQVKPAEVPLEKPAEQVDAKKITPKDIDVNQFVTVRNGFHGVLVYRSPRTGEIFEWDSFGAEQEMDLRELRNAKSSSKAFFINNWFMFDDEFAWVIDWLGVRQYYKHFLSIDDFDSIFDRSPDQLRDIVSGLSDGQKRSLAYRAYELIADGRLDSLKLISALEESLGIELIEK